MEDSALEELRAYVAKSGMKSSRQRELIAEVFFDAGGHRRVEDLWIEVRKIDPKIGQATVYRTMKLLTECGLAVVHQFGEGHARYEPVDKAHSHHDHIICNDCGQIKEFFNADLENLQDKIAKENGFQLTMHKMELYGKCLKENCEYRDSQLANQ